MRNGQALDHDDGFADDHTGTGTPEHELELDPSGWDDESTGGDPRPPKTAKTPAAKKAPAKRTKGRK